MKIIHNSAKMFVAFFSLLILTFDSCFCKSVLGGVWSLRNLTLTAPRAVLSGEGNAVLLRCDYELEGAALYSARWYRADTEFYRYVPREMPPTMVFPLPGAAVDLSSSDAKQVRVVGLHRRLSGIYQCEVSADAPLFHTEIRSARVTIVDPPFRAPRLSVSRSSFTRGAVVRAHCSVDDSYPATNITWLLDGYKIAEYVSAAPPELDFKERGANSSLELLVGGNPTDAPELPYYHRQEKRSQDPLSYSVPPPLGGTLSLSCVAVIHDVYARRSEPLTLTEDTPRPASVTTDDKGAGAGAGGAAISLVLLLPAALCMSLAL